MSSEQGQGNNKQMFVVKESINKYWRQKVSGNINFKLLTISPTTYVKISPQTVIKVSTIFCVPVIPGI